jgi:hypothetical protein
MMSRKDEFVYNTCFSFYIVTDEAYYQSTDFSRVLRNRTQMCGKNHEVSIFLPSSKDKQAKVGPVAWDIVKLVCNILCTILKHSTIAQRYLDLYLFHNLMSEWLV